MVDLSKFTSNYKILIGVILFRITPCVIWIQSYIYIYNIFFCFIYLMKNILFSYKSIIYYYIYDGVSELINVIYNIQYFRLWCSHPFIYIYIYI